MYEAKQEITEAANRVFGALSALKRGETLPHERVMAMLGLRPHEGAWDHIVNKARRRMERENGITVLCTVGVGYYLLTPTEQLAEPLRRALRAKRQVRRGRKSVEALPEKGLTVNQRRDRATKIAHAKDMERAIRRDAKAMTALARPTQSLPKRLMPPGAQTQPPTP